MIVKTGFGFLLLLAVAAATGPLSEAHQQHRRHLSTSRRSLAQTEVSSIAVSRGPGSRSEVSSVGQGNVNVAGIGAAGPGETVVVDCRAASQDERINRLCVGRPESAQNGGASAAGSSSSAWASAPVCKSSPVGGTIIKDSQGNPWGWENNASCAFRDASGKPVDAATQAISQASGGAASAPACAQDPGASAVVDQSGRKWGYENGKSCEVRTQAAAGK